MAEPAIKRLGTFLADLTHDKPPDQIHQEILDRLRDPDQDLDHRLAGIYLHVRDFVPIWTAIRNGVSLPASSWETVVLPAVVHFSPPHSLKPNLESVTNLFLNARGTRALEAALEDEPAPGPASYGPGSLSLLDSVFDEEPPQLSAPQPPPTAVVAAKTGRRWVPQTTAVAVVAVAAVAIWTGGGGENGGGAAFSALPQRPGATVPSGDPSPSAQPSLPSPSPGAPSPATGAAPPPNAPPPASLPPSRIPSAPTGLAASNVDRNSLTLAWVAPRDTGNVAYYKIFQDGTVIGQLTGTTDEVLNLRPATTYTFAVRAYNQAGQESPPSNSVTVTTAIPAPATFDVPSSVAFGSSFNVGGTGWMCPDVHISITGNLIEIGKVDEFDSFDAQIQVHEQYGEPGWVDIIGGGSMHLTEGTWPILASCPQGQSRSATVTVSP